MIFNYQFMKFAVVSGSGLDLPTPMLWCCCLAGLDWPLCHCAVAQCDEHRRPLAPSKFFDLCVTEKNSVIAVAPCLRPWS